MLTLTRRLSLVAAIAIAVTAPATTAGGEAPLLEPNRPGGIVDLDCQHGIHSLKQYTWYASRVYRLEKVSHRAERRMRYIRQCQRSQWGERWAARYHRRYKREREARALAARVFPVRPHLRRIAQCESGGNPRAISPNGLYRGKYQFSFSTWRSVGGRGDPAAASEYEQDKRAEILYRTGGPGHWPVCQHR